MQKINSLNNFKEMAQAAFESNEDSLAKYGKTDSTQMKAYLIETNCKKVEDAGCPLGSWVRLEDTDSWFKNVTPDPQYNEQLFLDASNARIWKIYTLLRVSNSDNIIDNWTKRKRGLDSCWLTRNHLLQWEGQINWESRGMGIRFDDGLYGPEYSTGFSLKAWHGANERIPQLYDLINQARNEFALHSVRWQKRSNGGISILMEWYNNGKVTINRASDIDEVLNTVTQMASRYGDGLKTASGLRDEKMAPFELNFSQKIQPQIFKETVEQGKGNMKLWLMEIESQNGFSRYRGVDMHTWDRVLLDVGDDFAYLTIPGKGCVNAAPRLAAIQGMDNSGNTSILFDGDEIFA